MLTHKAVQLYPPIPLTFQLLIVPVTDNTASASGVPHASWRENRHTPWLSPARMLWFRRQYLPHESTWSRWDASPLLAQDEMFRRVPKAWIAVTELDILRDEGISYGHKLLKAGVPTEIKTYKAAPHPIMAMDGTYHSACSTTIISLCAQHPRYSMFRVSCCGLWVISNLTASQSVLRIGKQLVSDAAAALAQAFGTANALGKDHEL